LEIEGKKDEDDLKENFWSSHFSADSFQFHPSPFLSISLTLLYSNSMKDVFAKSIPLDTAGTLEVKFNGIPSLVFSFLFNVQLSPLAKYFLIELPRIGNHRVKYN